MNSESIGKISVAILKAQKEMEGVVKDKDNPYFKSTYADLPAVLQACKNALNSNGITILQPNQIVEIGGEIKEVVKTILLHESGEFLSGITPIKCKDPNDPQKFGAGVTYARRQGLQSFIALPAEDDDGNKAAGNEPKGREPSKKEVKKDDKKEDTSRRRTRVENQEEKPKVETPKEDNSDWD